MQRIQVSIIVFIVSIGVCFSQNTRNAEAPKPPRAQYQAQKVEKKSFLSFKKKKRSNQLAVTSKEEFRASVLKRQRENAKKEYKLAKVERKEAKKGESFFGHKRPPKKRPPGKQKFCKVCRLKH